MILKLSLGLDGLRFTPSSDPPPAGAAEVTAIDLSGLDGAHFATMSEGRYFSISDNDGLCCIYFIVEVETQPSFTAPRYRAVGLDVLDDANAIAGKLRDTLNAELLVTAVAAGAVVTVTDDSTGARDDAADGSTTAIIATIQQGE